MSDPGHEPECASWVPGSDCSCPRSWDRLRSGRVTHTDLARSIRMGSLPVCLVGGDPDRYRGPDRLEPSWDGWLRMWWSVAYVRMQGFERDEEALYSSELFG